MLYPINEWERITAKLRKLNLFVAKNRKFHRQFHNGATPLQPDGAGRVLLPKSLLGYAQIKKDVVVFGYADRFEIWAKDQYEVEMTDGLDDFADLAEEVMGDLAAMTNSNYHIPVLLNDVIEGLADSAEWHLCGCYVWWWRTLEGNSGTIGGRPINRFRSR